MELDYKTQWGSTEKVTIDINSYLNNGCLYIGLVSHEEGYPEPFGDLTSMMSPTFLPKMAIPIGDSFDILF